LFSLFFIFESLFFISFSFIYLSLFLYIYCFLKWVQSQSISEKLSKSKTHTRTQEQTFVPILNPVLKVCFFLTNSNHNPGPINTTCKTTKKNNRRRTKDPKIQYQKPAKSQTISLPQNFQTLIEFKSNPNTITNRSHYHQHKSSQYTQSDPNNLKISHDSSRNRAQSTNSKRASNRHKHQ